MATEGKSDMPWETHLKMIRCRLENVENNEMGGGGGQEDQRNDTTEKWIFKPGSLICFATVSCLMLTTRRHLYNTIFCLKIRFTGACF